MRQCVFLLMISVCAAQNTFEVASIKRNASAAEGGSVRLTPGGRLVAQNVALRYLIGTAYDVRDFQLVGGSGWIASDRFDIEAKATENASPEQMSQMLQLLLRDRFGLLVHREQRELPIYRLILARAGSKLQAAKGGDCTPMIPPPVKFDPVTLRPCGGFNNGSGSLRGGSVGMARLATALSRVLGRTVVDQTGLRGAYDVDLNWTPDAGVATDAPSALPSIFTAVQEQLGLRLEAGRGPVTVLVVDSAEPPSEN